MKLAKPIALFRALLFCGGYLGFAASAQTASLGPLLGTAIIGRPLDVQLVVKNDGQLPAPGKVSCLSASVRFGDNLVATERVVLSELTEAADGEARARIRTLVGVDEPLVSVTVTHGCQQKITRSYVLLAELLPPSQTNPAPATAGTAAQTALPQPPPPPLNLPRQAPSNATTSRSPPEARKTNPANPAAVASGRPAKKSAPGSDATIPQTVSRPRLVMQPLDFYADTLAPGGLSLRPSAEMTSVPSSDPQIRKTAALLWQSLNAQPQDFEQANEKLLSLQANNLALQAQLAQAKTANTNPTKAVPEEARNAPLFTSMVWLPWVLLLFVASLLVWLLMGKRNAKNTDQTLAAAWWKPQEKSRSPKAGAASQFSDSLAFAQNSVNLPLPPVPAPPPSAARSGFFNTAISAREAPPSTVDLNNLFQTSSPHSQQNAFQNSFQHSQQNIFQNSFQHSASKQPSDGFAFTVPSGSPKKGIIDAPELSQFATVEEILAIHEKANHCVSLGDIYGALDILQNHISINMDNTSALVFLDLFDLYHILGMRDEYNFLRIEFNRLYSVEIDEFTHYCSESMDLEMYPAAMQRIQDLWPRIEVLHVVEKSIITKPSEMDGCFSLQAYRDLLMLYSVANCIVKETQAYLNSQDDFDPVKNKYSGRSAFINRNLKPLSTEARPREPFISLVLPASAPVGYPGNSLDIDLSAEEDREDSMRVGLPPPKPQDKQTPTKPAPSNLLDFDL